MADVSEAIPVQQLLEQIRERADEQRSIHVMLRRVYLSASDFKLDPEDLWEGFAAIARTTTRDCEQISELIEDAQAQLRQDAAR